MSATWYSNETDGGELGVDDKTGQFYVCTKDGFYNGRVSPEESRSLAEKLLFNEINPETSRAQLAIRKWIVSVFGKRALEDTKERSLRFAEEALELVQATQVSKEDLHRLVDYVYDRPVGSIPQEVGGVVVTLLGLAANLDLNVTAAFHKELKRILDPAMVEKMKAKQKAKAKQGVGASYP